MNTNITIILTSTVNVNRNKSHLFQTDKNERIQTYVKSVRQWLRKTNFKIILVENSGYNYDELRTARYVYDGRFEILTFTENELEGAQYLKTSTSKGSSEIFAINYAFLHSKLINNLTFIIKITARYYIPEFEEYLSKYDLNVYDCLTQYDRDRCEMVGSHYKNFGFIFNKNLTDKNNRWNGHVEEVWKERTSQCKQILICKKFQIEPTQRGGVKWVYDDI